MDADDPATEESPRKRPRSQGCKVCGELKQAHERDPASRLWYCRVCFFDVRPDIACQQSRSIPTHRIVGKTALSAISLRASQSYSPRCFVCFLKSDDVTESTCGLQQSQLCCAVRLCSGCRAAHAVDRCFFCWAITKECYKCQGRIPHYATRAYKNRLCEKCGNDEKILRCYFCRRSHSSVRYIEECHFCTLARQKQVALAARHTDPVPTCDICLNLHGFDHPCRSCFAREWKGRCFRCGEKWAQRSKSHFCSSCYEVLFLHPQQVAIEVFRNLPEHEWYARRGPAWFHKKHVGMMFPLYPKMTHVGAEEIIERNYVLLDEEMCLTIAEAVPTWARHLQRLCGKLQGQVPLYHSLFSKIMGCPFQYEGEALTSRWEGGLIEDFCVVTREVTACDHRRCKALQAPRLSGKLCFMELVEAVAAKLPICAAVGDTIDTASWGQFIVKEADVQHWLNDYSNYFANSCDWSWEKAVTLYVKSHRRYRLVTTYLCALCSPYKYGREARSSSGEIQSAFLPWRTDKARSKPVRYCEKCLPNASALLQELASVEQKPREPYGAVVQS